VRGGFTPSGLERLHRVMERHVASGYVPGLVALVHRGEETHVEALGTRVLGKDAPMRRDTIFRLASATKPITAAAVLMLLEECELRLDDPLTELLPELRDARVLREPTGPLDDTVAADRAITTRDLLTFASGYGADFGNLDSPLMTKMSQIGVQAGPVAPDLTPEEWLRRLGTLPLAHQPGHGWLYNHGSDLAGIVISRVTGQPLSHFLRERIFTPLGMQDTAFFVPPEKLSRFGPEYRETDDSSLIVDDPADGHFSRPPIFEQGSGGLVTTADDLLAFQRFLLGGGRAGSQRLLSRASVSLLQTNQLSAAQGQPLGPDQGWTFGCSVDLRQTGLGSSAGRYGWIGGSGTAVYADPRAGSIDILLTQRLMEGPGSPPMADLAVAAYAAFDE
jgi:CubicO group peptidase (beta-lactamase class C family)